jgi:ADP-heptose:LPS heptosyltransferase
VLIIRNQGLGDLILITPAIRAIRALHPAAHLAIVVGDWSRAALEGNPNLDEIISYPDTWIQDKQLFGYIRLIKRLRKGHFGIAYIFHSHPLIHLMGRLAGIPRRYGFFDPQLSKKGGSLTARTEWQPNTDRYIADNYLDIPRLAGFQGEDLRLDFFPSEQETQQTSELLSKYRLTPAHYIVIAPGGGVNPRQNVFEKRWGTDKYTDLCKLLAGNPGFPLLLVGSSQEHDLGMEITSRLGDGIIDFIGRIPFRLTAGLIRNAAMLISNDSSVMHLAVAFDIPSLAVFGPSNPRSLLPVSKLNQWISSGVDCSPCYCNSIFQGCDHLRCMRELSPDTVHARVLQMLETKDQSQLQ